MTKEQLQLIQALDGEILKMLEDMGDLEEDAFSREIEEAASLKSDVKVTIRLMNEKLNQGEGSSSEQSDVGEQQSVRQHVVRVKLPKLEIRKFDGKV